MAAGPERGKYKYRLPDLLGKGAFAMVFRGVGLSGAHVGRAVAIKRIDMTRLMGDARLQRLFRTEVDILRQLGHHPHVVELLDYFESRDKQYAHLVLELCDSGDLHAHLKAHAPLPPPQVADMTRQLAAGMQYLHSKSVVHRDIKPQNVLLHADDTRLCGHVVKITDFGFSIRLQQQDLTATFCGSPLHMAPEILLGSPYDPKVDLFSLGTIVYTMAVGREPFPAQTLAELRRKLGSKQARTVPLPTGMEADLADLLRGLLRLDPVTRISFEAFFRHPYLCRPQRLASACTTPTPPAVSNAASASVLALSNAARTSIDQYCMVDRHAVEFSELLGRLHQQRNLQRTPVDDQREERLRAVVGRTVDQVDHVLEVADQLHQSPTDAAAGNAPARARAEQLLLYGHALLLLRETIRDTREPLRQLQAQPLSSTMLQAERFRAALHFCTTRIQAMRPLVAADNPAEGVDVALGPDDILLATVQRYVEEAEALAGRWEAPSDAQWRLRQSVLVAAQELVSVLRRALERAGAGSSGGGVDTVTCMAARRLDGQARHIADLLRRSKPLPIARGSQPAVLAAPRRLPSSGTDASLAASLLRARFCGACGAKFVGASDNYCPCCGAQRALLSSGGLSLLAQSPGGLSRTVL